VSDDIRYHRRSFTNNRSLAVNSSLIVHEARHAQGWQHVSNSSGGQVDQSWAADGAYKHTVVWLNNLYLYGNIDYLGSAVDVCTEGGGQRHRGHNESQHWDGMLSFAQSVLNQKFIQRPAYVFKPKLCGWTLSEQPRGGG
jgi:hypothetical protein